MFYYEIYIYISNINFNYYRFKKFINQQKKKEKKGKKKKLYIIDFNNNHANLLLSLNCYPFLYINI